MDEWRDGWKDCYRLEVRVTRYVMMVGCTQYEMWFPEIVSVKAINKNVDYDDNSF